MRRTLFAATMASAVACGPGAMRIGARSPAYEEPSRIGPPVEEDIRIGAEEEPEPYDEDIRIGAEEEPVEEPVDEPVEPTEETKLNDSIRIGPPPPPPVKKPIRIGPARRPR